MARFDTYAKKTTPVADDTVLLYDSENRNNKQLKASDLGKYIVDNFSGSMRGTSISSNTDLNDLTTPGAYFCATSAIAGSLANCPIAVNFTMLVMKKHTNLQTQVLFANSRIFLRSRTSSGWQDWFTMACVENDIEPLQEQVGPLKYVDFVIDAGATKTFNYPASTRAKMLITGVDTRYFTESIITSAGNGRIYHTETVSGSWVDIDFSVAKKITITNNAPTYAARVGFLIMTAGKSITEDTTTSTTTTEGGE